MSVSDPVEFMYLMLMLRWENSAPPDKRQGLLDGVPERNCQITRLAYLLAQIAGGDQRIYEAFSRHSRRDDGYSYIARDPRWMNNPRDIGHGWFLEGCACLSRKQEILECLTCIGYSGRFASCADDFVAGRSVHHYIPNQFVKLMH